MTALRYSRPSLYRQTNVFRLINANFATSVANNEISVGKADDWWGPTQTGSMALSNNAEPIYALRINRVVPLHIPLLLRRARARFAMKDYLAR